MKTSTRPHLGQSVGFAIVLAIMSVGVIVLMTLASGQL